MFLFFQLVSICCVLTILVDASPMARRNLRPFNHRRLKHRTLENISNVTAGDYPALDNTAGGILTRATPRPPHFFAYGVSSRQGVPEPPTTDKIQGFNVYALAFWHSRGPSDHAKEWEQLSAERRASIKAQYASAGIKLVVSAFGDADFPTKLDPNAIANAMADWVIKFKLDGIDVDYEDFAAFNSGTGEAEKWLISFTRQIRRRLPVGTYLLTHAPVAPWFSPDTWHGGGYLHVNKVVGHLIDWYNIQFYNQGNSEYTTCAGLLTKSSRNSPKSSVFEIAASGIPLDKIVIGKPAIASDANNGFMSTSTLSSCLLQAKQEGWSGGVMVWEFPHADAAWISSVRSPAFPESVPRGIF